MIIDTWGIYHKSSSASCLSTSCCEKEVTYWGHLIRSPRYASMKGISPVWLKECIWGLGYWQIIMFWYSPILGLIPSSSFLGIHILYFDYILSLMLQMWQNLTNCFHWLWFTLNYLSLLSFPSDPIPQKRSLHKSLILSTSHSFINPGLWILSSFPLGNFLLRGYQWQHGHQMQCHFLSSYLISLFKNQLLLLTLSPYLEIYPSLSSKNPAFLEVISDHIFLSLSDCSICLHRIF